MRARWSSLAPLALSLLLPAAGRAGEAAAAPQPPHLPAGMNPLSMEGAKHVAELLRTLRSTAGSRRSGRSPPAR